MQIFKIFFDLYLASKLIFLMLNITSMQKNIFIIFWSALVYECDEESFL